MLRKKEILEYEMPEISKGTKLKDDKGYVMAKCIDNVIIADCYKGNTKVARYANDGNNYITYNYEKSTWNTVGIEGAFNPGVEHSERYWTPDYISAYSVISIGDSNEEIKAHEAAKSHHYSKGAEVLQNIEREIHSDRRDRARERREARIKEVMDKVPPISAEAENWIQTVVFGVDYIVKNKETNSHYCAICEKTLTGTYRHNEHIICHGREVVIKKRQTEVFEKQRVCIIQPIDLGHGKKSIVMRHINAYRKTDAGTFKTRTKEVLRDVYQWDESGEIGYGRYHNCTGYFGDAYWWDANANGAHATDSYIWLEPGTLSGTTYEHIGLEILHGTDKRINPTLLTMFEKEWRYIGIEYMLRRKLWRFTRELVDTQYVWGNGRYTGTMAKMIKSVDAGKNPLMIDKQRANRLAELDGGKGAWNWLRYEEETGVKVPQETLKVFISRNIMPNKVKFVLDYMTPTQIANYVVKQEPKASRTGVLLERWEDYMSMAKRLKMDPKDCIVHRPKDVYRMHDLLAAEIALRNKELEAEKSRAKYPDAEENMRRISEKFGYEGAEYIVSAPTTLQEIMADGAALHHCGGASERYIERIQNKESYILFLRKANTPEVPYYTLEVEPAGTIRQKRSEYNRQPDMEKIMPFLREWQQEVRKRITAEDLAEQSISTEKRIASYAELKARSEYDAQFARKMEADLMDINEEEDAVVFLAAGA